MGVILKISDPVYRKAVYSPFVDSLSQTAILVLFVLPYSLSLATSFKFDSL